eukprot:m.174392 g.174392  ORF g.174392 m.174392 type:complete len:73 (+) comp31765_c4_seq3:1203-1421(+)
MQLVDFVDCLVVFQVLMLVLVLAVVLVALALFDVLLILGVTSSVVELLALALVCNVELGDRFKRKGMGGRDV